MEKEKRKRCAADEKERNKEGTVVIEKKKKKKKIRKEEETNEKEVEEFFAILKRMKAVVQYFDKGGAGDQGWRAAVEAQRPVDAGGGDDSAKDFIGNDKMRKEGVEENGVFDLNAAPEAEEEDGVEEDNPIN